MNIVPLHRECMQIWMGTLKGTSGPRWFVEHCDPEGVEIVADFAIEADAVTEAAGWGLPVVRLRDRS